MSVEAIRFYEKAGVLPAAQRDASGYRVYDESTLRLLGTLEEIVIDAGGRIYPAKDSVMSAKSFAAGYPELERFRASIDPRFASGFARRVGLIEKLDTAQ